MAHPQPVMLAAGTQQYLSYCQADQLGVGQLLWPARAALGRGNHMIVDRHIQCRQEGVELAVALHITGHTAKTHMASLLHKLGLRDRVHAVIFAYESGMVAPG